MDSYSVGHEASTRSSIGVAAPGGKPISAPVLMSVAAFLDLALLLAAAWLAAIAVNVSLQTPWRPDMALAGIIGAGASWIYISAHKAYSLEMFRSFERQISLIVKAIVIAVGVSITCLFVVQAEGPAERAFPFAFGVSAFLVLALFRLVLGSLVAQWTRDGRFRRRIAIVALNEFSLKFIERLQAEPNAFEVAGVYDDRLRSERVPPALANVPVRGSVADLVRDSRDEHFDVIAVALPLGAVDRIAAVLEQLSSTVADVCLTTDLAGFSYRVDQFGALGSNPVISIDEAPMKDWRAAKKAAFDYLVGAIALVILAPVLAFIALVVRLDSKGPALFRQPRLGFNNRMFTCYKFRTMYTDKTDVLADRQTTRDDPRVTRSGKWLRKLSLDELPQLLNVMNGSMSLVGPRPHAPNTKAANRLFAEVVQQYALRHRVKPGITGWAQVNGWRGETATVEQIQNRVRCDLYYIDNWSLIFDLKIIALTVLRELYSKRAF
ncbi:undecaprenyl-phosphate glucose phosphotransferase [Methylocapsa palsarum]|uniref:Undecaprenyl-phosphate glucose phosphotransferase n=1 Tax=Methylocapsa palsarum TaxID=1612308 RepID=A0A1I4CKH2_9HYPH|nr:undecaprenyl-phosphate glucose phosphotransferase [Methylocapsa palsarum]SFK81738.1 Undecaprenyl-phosphate glucose phosphotransferase [Methylocapsa palsarum]